MQAYINQGDLGLFFDRAQIPKENVITYVKQLIEYEELPADQRVISDRRKETLVDNYMSQQQNAALAMQNETLMKGQLELEFKQALSLPEVSSFVERFDEKLGTGAFRQHADQFGRTYYASNGRDTSVIEAVKHVMKEYQPLLGEGVSSAQSGLESVKREREDSKPDGHIPNIGRGAANTSPTKPRFTDLKTLQEHINKKLDGTNG